MASISLWTSRSALVIFFFVAMDQSTSDSPEQATCNTWAMAKKREPIDDLIDAYVWMRQNAHR
jgi:hypothetical protein